MLFHKSSFPPFSHVVSALFFLAQYCTSPNSLLPHPPQKPNHFSTYLFHFPLLLFSDPFPLSNHLRTNILYPYPSIIRDHTRYQHSLPHSAIIRFPVQLHFDGGIVDQRIYLCVQQDTTTSPIRTNIDIWVFGIRGRVAVSTESISGGEFEQRSSRR